MSESRMVFEYDSAIAEQLLTYLQKQASRTDEEVERDDELMTAADNQCATLLAERVTVPNCDKVESLESFFTPQIMGRILYCPRINCDVTDDWGLSGYEPGFILVGPMNYTGIRCLSDRLWLQGRSIRTVPGLMVPAIGSWDSFPKIKFGFDIISPTHNPKTYAFLVNKTQMPCLPAQP